MDLPDEMDGGHVSRYGEILDGHIWLNYGGDRVQLCAIHTTNGVSRVPGGYHDKTNVGCCLWNASTRGACGDNISGHAWLDDGGIALPALRGPEACSAIHRPGLPCW